MLGSFYDFSSLCFSRSGGSERFFYRGVGMKKITAYFLCFLLVFFTPSAVFASSAGSVVVSGGSIASGGLSGGYSQASESAAVTITMALLYSLGITVNLSQTALDAGQSAYSFVRDKMAEWVGGSSAEQLSDVYGLSYAPTSDLYPLCAYNSNKEPVICPQSLFPNPAACFPDREQPTNNDFYQLMTYFPP